MKVFEVNITETVHKSCTVYIKAEDWESAEEIARDDYRDGVYDAQLNEWQNEHFDDVAIEVEEMDDDL